MITMTAVQDKLNLTSSSVHISLNYYSTASYYSHHHSMLSYPISLSIPLSLSLSIYLSIYLSLSISIFISLSPSQCVTLTPEMYRSIPFPYQYRHSHAYLPLCKSILSLNITHTLHLPASLLFTASLLLLLLPRLLLSFHVPSIRSMPHPLSAANTLIWSKVTVKLEIITTFSSGLSARRFCKKQSTVCVHVHVVKSY